MQIAAQVLKKAICTLVLKYATGDKTMSWRNYLFYINKRLSGKRWMMYLNVLVSAAALAVLGINVSILLTLHHDETMIRKALADDISKFGVVRNGGDLIFDEYVHDYISALYNAPEISGVGTWTCGGFEKKTTVGGETDYWQKILEIQNSHVREFDENPNHVQLVYMPGQAFPINHLELYSGNTEQIGKNDGYLMYLGYYFKDIPVGTVFQDEKYGTFYVVEGILQKNASIVDSTALLWNLGGLKLSSSVAMDNMILLIAPSSQSYFSSVFFFKCADGYTYEDAAGKIKEISEEYAIPTEVGTLEKRIDTVLSDVDWLLKGISKLSVLIFFAAFIMIMTTQLLTILFRKEELGVWLISGIGRKQIFMILLGENLVKLIPAALIAFGSVLLYNNLGNVSLNISSSAIYGLRYIFWGKVPLFLLLSVVFMTFLCSAVPIAYIKKKSIPDIVRGTWE